VFEEKCSWQEILPALALSKREMRRHPDFSSANDLLADQPSLRDRIIERKSEISDIEIQFPLGLSRSATTVASGREQQRTSDSRIIPEYGKWRIEENRADRARHG
jgi:hypothetical protein